MGKDDAPGGIPPLHFRTRLAYGSGAIAFAVKNAGFGGFLLLFYNQVVGLPASLVGMALAISLVVDAVIDPLIGYVSDNWRSRWGRRHPFMYLAALPSAVLFLVIWIPPAGWSEGALFAYLLLSVIALRFSISFFEIPSGALLAELTGQYAERTSLFAYRQLFGGLAGIGITVVMFSVFLQPTEAYPVGQLNRTGYEWFGVVAAVLIFASIAVSSLGTHERIPFLPRPPLRASFSFRGSLAEIGQSVRNRSFLIILLAGVFAAIGAGLTGSLGLYFGIYYWGLHPDQQSVLTLAGVPAILIGAGAAAPLVRMVGKRNAAVALTGGLMAAALAPYGLRLAGLFPANGTPALIVWLFVFGVLSTAFAIMAFTVTGSMLADVVEESEIETGRRSEGLFLAANTFVLQCVGGLGLLVSGFILSMIEFPAGASPEQVSPDILHNLVIVFLPLLIVLNVLTMLCLSRYRISRATHEDNLRKLAARHVCGNVSS